MKKQEILEIAKNLIIISAKYGKENNQLKKQKIIDTFNDYEKKLKSNKTKYSSTILSFVKDLKEDLKEGRELNIDNLATDEYLENYLLTKQELTIYNNLILIPEYKKIFSILKNKKDLKKIEILLKKIEKNYYSNLKKLNLKIIAQNLLIFTCFNRIIAKQYLLNLYDLLPENGHKQIVIKMLNTGNKIIKKIKFYSFESYKNNNFNYKYIGFASKNGKTVLNDKIVDCSFIFERTGFPKYEYKKLLIKL